MYKDKSNKTPYLIKLIILCCLLNIGLTYACIGQYGEISPVPTYPSNPFKIPKDIERVGENTLVILVDFSGCAGTTTQAQWNNILLTTNTPGSSMRDYYLEVSNSNVSLVGAQENSGTVNNGVAGWYTMPFAHPCITYGTGWQNTTGESLPGMPYMGPGWKNTWALSRQLAYLAIKAADPNVNYAQFNHEHYGSGTPPILGYVYAHIIIIVAGYEGSYYGAPTPYTWRHHWYMPGDGYQSGDICSCWPINGYMCIGGSVLGYGYSLIGEKTPTGSIIGQGLISHEVGHDLGLPDLYDTDGSTNGYGNGVGEWCLMAGADWLGSPYASKPGHFSAWCKVDRGWITPTVVQNAKLSNLQIPAVESVPVIYKLLPYNLPNCRQYFLVENRQLKKFDGDINGAGLLIYHCDDSMIGLNRSTNKVNTRVGYTNSNHFGVDVECEDGFPLGSLDHLDSEASGNRGDANDPWNGDADFDTNSTPNSSVYYSSKSYVAVKNISMSGGIVTADLWTLPPGIVFSASPPSINFSDVNVGSSKTDSVTVTNNGTTILTISSAASDNSEFDVTPISAVLEPDSSKKFYITFSPTSTGSKLGNIEFVHNGPSSPDTVTVSGNGISSGVAGWAQKESIPHPPDLKPNKNVKDGGAMTSEQGKIYVFPGNKSWQFYKYTQGTPGFWTQLESIPYGYKPNVIPPTINKKKVSKGASLCAEDKRIYATKGNSTKEFWAYLIDDEDTLPADTWVQLAPVPSIKGLKGGTSILHWGRQHTHKIYLLAGSQKNTDPNFFVYDMGTGLWDTLPRIPLTPDNKPFKDGSCIVLADKKIWALKGGGKYNYFWMYDSTLRSWRLRESIPQAHPDIKRKKKVKNGGAMTVCDDLIYAIKGGGSNEFWAYNYEDSTWYPKDTIPKLHKKSIPKAGAAITELDDKVWLLKGNDTREFWCYTPEAKSNIKNQISNITESVIAGTKFMAISNFSISPNPFTNFTTIRYNVPISGKVSIKLYNSTGKLISTLLDENKTAGSYSFEIRNLTFEIPAGIYFLKYETNTSNSELKLIVQ